MIPLLLLGIGSLFAGGYFFSGASKTLEAVPEALGKIPIVPLAMTGVGVYLISKATGKWKYIGYGATALGIMMLLKEYGIMDLFTVLAGGSGSATDATATDTSVWTSSGAPDVNKVFYSGGSLPIKVTPSATTKWIIDTGTAAIAPETQKIYNMLYPNGDPFYWWKLWW